MAFTCVGFGTIAADFDQSGKGLSGGEQLESTVPNDWFNVNYGAAIVKTLLAPLVKKPRSKKLPVRLAAF
jgi:hypothetical protein